MHDIDIFYHSAFVRECLYETDLIIKKDSLSVDWINHQSQRLSSLKALVRYYTVRPL